MSKRTQVWDYDKIEVADDVERVVRDKRACHRGGKRKKHRRHRHYVKTLLRHMADDDEVGAQGDDLG